MSDQQEPASKKLKPNHENPEEAEATMNDLPELPFEKMLSYLDLQDLLRSRAVSRRWRETIDNFKVKSLFYSEIDLHYFIVGKSRLVCGVFAHNFIRTTRFDAFFPTFAQSTLFNLRHLRLSYLLLDERNRTAFARILNLFGRLEKLEIRSWFLETEAESDQIPSLDLNLPMLESIHLEKVYAIKKLTLDAPRLAKIKILDCDSMRLDLIHAESVETLALDTKYLEVAKLTNLKYFFVDPECALRSIMLLVLTKLKEIHLLDFKRVRKALKMKQLFRADLKIFYFGLLLDGPDDLTKFSGSSGFEYVADEAIWRRLTENPSALASEIPFYTILEYSKIEPFVARLQTTVLNRLTDLSSIHISEPIQDIQRFLDFLKSLDTNDIQLYFLCDQPQDLFDRLPDAMPHLEGLYISMKVLNLDFLLRFKNLIHLKLFCSVDSGFIQKAFKEFEFCLCLEFKYANKDIRVKVQGIVEASKRFFVLIDKEESPEIPNLNAAIEFLKAIEEQPLA